MGDKLVYIETLGCAMNERDSAHLLGELESKEGYKETKDIKQADLILINTCSVREKPELRLFSDIGVIAKSKKPSAKIGICGCSASSLGEKIIKRAKVVDFVLGARNTSKITEILHKKGAVEIDIDYDDSTYVFGQSSTINDSKKAMLNISIGCDKKCSYCIVPFTRGKEISIPLDMLVNEARKLANNGIKELMLLGQNVNNYGVRFSIPHKEVNFTTLLQEISKIDGIERIRFTSPHPLHMDDAFIEEFVNNPKIAKSIHIPLQSGSTKILRKMKRGYDKEWFLNRIDKIKNLCKQNNIDVGIGTDIIVGFPEESEEDFEDTLDVLKKVEFDTMYSFVYSPRPNTSAWDIDKSLLVDKQIAKKRLKILQDTHKSILRQKALREIGKIHSVIIENNRDDKDAIFSEGRSGSNKVIKIDGIYLPLGEMLNVKITKSKGGSLQGQIYDK